MPIKRVHNAGSVGYIDRTDKEPYELPPEAWSFVQNARMRNGRAESVNPWVEVPLVPGDLGDDTIHALDFYTAPVGSEQWIYAYGEAKIYSIDAFGNVLTVNKNDGGGEITHEDYPAQIWITDQFNSVPVATNNKAAPQCFYAGGADIAPSTISQDLPDWGVGGAYEGHTCRILRTYKNFLIALNITTPTAAFPNLIRWSDSADPGLLPTTWAPGTDNLAGSLTTPTEAGAIVGAEVLRDSLFVYLEYAVYRLDFVRGNAVMRLTKVFDKFGSFGPRAITRFGARHIVLTKSDVVAHDGQQWQSIADMRVRNALLFSLSQKNENQVWVQSYLRFSEIFVGLPGAVEKFLTAVVWQAEDNVWSVRALNDSRYMRELPVLQEDQVDDSWDGGRDDSWNEGLDIPWESAGSVGDLRPVITSTDGKLYVLDEGDQVDDTVLRREDLNLVDDQSIQMLVDVYPRVSSPQALQVRVGSSFTVDGPMTWGSYVDYLPNSDYKVAVRQTGRRHGIEFRGRAFNLEGYDLKYEPAGQR